MTWQEVAQLASKADVDGKADLDPLTGKVVASQLPAGGGGGGAGIDDSITGLDTAWSSEKTAQELAGKADDNWVMLDPETGEPVEGTDMPLSVGLDTTWLTALGVGAGLGMRLEVDNQLESGPNQGFLLKLVREIPPGDAFPNTIFAVVAPDGEISLHLRNLGV